MSTAASEAHIACPKGEGVPRTPSRRSTLCTPLSDNLERGPQEAVLACEKWARPVVVQMVYAARNLTAQQDWT